MQTVAPSPTHAADGARRPKSFTPVSPLKEETERHTGCAPNSARGNVRGLGRARNPNPAIRTLTWLPNEPSTSERVQSAGLVFRLIVLIIIFWSFFYFFCLPSPQGVCAPNCSFWSQWHRKFVFERAMFEQKKKERKKTQKQLPDVPSFDLPFRRASKVNRIALYQMDSVCLTCTNIDFFS